MLGGKETCSIPEARNALIKESRSYGLYPTWKVPFAYTDQAGAGSTKADKALSQFEDAVREDLVRRLVDIILEFNYSADQKRHLISTVEKASNASKKANLPPTPVRVERPPILPELFRIKD